MHHESLCLNDPYTAPLSGRAQLQQHGRPRACDIAEEKLERFCRRHERRISHTSSCFKVTIFSRRIPHQNSSWHFQLLYLQKDLALQLLYLHLQLADTGQARLNVDNSL